MRVLIRLLVLTSAGLSWATAVAAQPLGTFIWQLQPFCNRLTVTVTQNGAIYTLDGTDDQCNAAQRAPLTGLATPNPDGTIGLGFNVVTVPGGAPVAIDARIPFPTLTGTWSDSAGNSGAFTFGANTGGSPRPVPTGSGGGDITAVTAGTGLTGGGTSGAVTLGVDPTEVQSRVTTACPAGQALRSINQNGTAVCQSTTGTGGGDITAVSPGPGLSGGGTTGDVTLDVAFGGDGVVNAVARADHEHLHNASSVVLGTSALAGGGVNNVAIGIDALRFTNSGSNNTAIGYQAARSVTDTSAVTAVGSEAFRNTTALGNTGLGAQAGRATTTGQQNTVVGAAALFTNQTGANNVAVGRAALQLATTGNNTAVGAFALDAATTGTFNTTLGQSTFSNLTTGSNNTALGNEAGAALVTGSQSTLVGDNADVGSGALTNATALGANAFVAQDNSLVLGSINGINGATADARVGIGTSTPDSTLDVERESSDITDPTSVMRTTYFGASNNNETLESLRARGTRAAPAPVLANDNLFTVSGGGYNGSAFAPLKAFVVAEASQDWTPSATGTRWKFATTPNNSNVSAERMRIEHNGRVGVGTTDPLDQLHVFGDIRVGTTGTNGCLRNAGGGVITGTCSSDLRFKRDITPFSASLDRLTALRPVHYFWRADAFPEKGFGGAPSYGLIAQEVEAVMPELVTTDERGFKAVDYGKLPLLAIQALRELKAQNEALERRLAALEAAIAKPREE